MFQSRGHSKSTFTQSDRIVTPSSSPCLLGACKMYVCFEGGQPKTWGGGPYERKQTRVTILWCLKWTEKLISICNNTYRIYSIERPFKCGTSRGVGGSHKMLRVDKFSYLMRFKCAVFVTKFATVSSFLDRIHNNGTESDLNQAIAALL